MFIWCNSSINLFLLFRQQWLQDDSKRRNVSIKSAGTGSEKKSRYLVGPIAKWLYTADIPYIPSIYSTFIILMESRPSICVHYLWAAQSTLSGQNTLTSQPRMLNNVCKYVHMYTVYIHSGTKWLWTFFF